MAADELELVEREAHQVEEAAFAEALVLLELQGTDDRHEDYGGDADKGERPERQDDGSEHEYADEHDCRDEVERA